MGADFNKPLVYGAATVRGPGHVRAGRPNDDAFAVFEARGFFFAAVADGVSSARSSTDGARLAVAVAFDTATTKLFHSDVLSLHLDDAMDDCTNIGKEIVRTWRNNWEQANVDPRDYDATLLFAALTPKRSLFGQIGDGLIARCRGGAIDFVAKPNKEFSNRPNSTLASRTADKDFHVVEVLGPPETQIDSFLLMTDGVSDDLSDPAAFSQYFVNFLNNTPRPWWNIGIERHLSEWPTKSHYDDKTLIVACFADSAQMTILGSSSAHAATT
jgi:serine/threonine protein phosphatase PrpC